MPDIFDSVFEARLKTALDKEIGRESENLANGLASDFSDYRNRVGRIDGLRIARSYCDSIRQTLLGNDKKD